jgi:uncharacterized membrane protein YraQ (UPF0718 family)
VVFHAIAHAGRMTLTMGWQILWALVLGFALSGVVQSVVSKKEMTRLLPDDSAGSVARAAGLGAASSSCSYAAIALARSMFRKGANFTAAIAFELASTNLVLELGILLAVLLAWQFTLAEFVGGSIMIVLLVVLFRTLLPAKTVDTARQRAERGLSGRMEGHAEMDMAVTDGSLWRRITSSKGFTAISHTFVMDWASVWTDVVLGVVVAGAVAACVPSSFWKAFFLVDHPLLAKIWGPIVGPIVGILSFVCSVGNVPLAAVLWNGGISFGGAVSFIFADLIVIPILLIYHKYYGAKMTLILLGSLYAAMVAAGYVVEVGFGLLGLVPPRSARVAEASVRWNYTSVLDIVFVLLAAVLFVRFLRTGGPKMLRMMSSDTSNDDHRAADIETDAAAPQHG